MKPAMRHGERSHETRGARRRSMITRSGYRSGAAHEHHEHHYRAH